MANIHNKLSQIKEKYSLFNERACTTTCWNLSTALQELEADLREHIQDLTKNQISGIISKLRNNVSLTKEDISYVKLWICGEAEYYAKIENNYNDWVLELKRLISEIESFSGQNSSFEVAANIKAQVLDAIRVLGDILFFLKQKDRVENFLKSTEDIDPEERNILIRLLEGKLYSPNE